MPAPKRDIKRWSSKLYGAECRLWIAAEIAACRTGEVFLSSDIAERLEDRGVDGATVSAQLTAWDSVGLVEKQKRDHYIKQASPYWNSCAKVLQDLDRRLAPAQLRRADAESSAVPE